MINVLLVDEQLLLREGLREILAQVSWMRVVAETGDLRQVRLLLRAHRPDVVLFDVSTPGSDPIPILPGIKGRYPAIGLLIVTSRKEDDFAIRCLSAGADGYVTTFRGTDELIGAIEKVASGGKYVTPTLGELLARSLDQTLDRRRRRHRAL